MQRVEQLRPERVAIREKRVGGSIGMQPAQVPQFAGGEIALSAHRPLNAARVPECLLDLVFLFDATICEFIPVLARDRFVMDADRSAHCDYQIRSHGRGLPTEHGRTHSQLVCDAGHRLVGLKWELLPDVEDVVSPFLQQERMEFQSR